MIIIYDCDSEGIIEQLDLISAEISKRNVEIIQKELEKMSDDELLLKYLEKKIQILERRISLCRSDISDIKYK